MAFLFLGLAAGATAVALTSDEAGAPPPGSPGGPTSAGGTMLMPGRHGPGTGQAGGMLTPGSATRGRVPTHVALVAAGGGGAQTAGGGDVAIHVRPAQRNLSPPLLLATSTRGAAALSATAPSSAVKTLRVCTKTAIGSALPPIRRPPGAPLVSRRWP
jgi:hypothetical protein